MPVIHYETAIEQIVSSYKHRCENKSDEEKGEIKEEKGDSPFFFIVGAGISFPSVPLAKDLCNEFRKKLKISTGDDSKPLNQDDYMSLFEMAYTEKSERRDYLSKIITEAQITSANFSLARLLAKKKGFTNLVITINFDDLLSKALTLFGENHLVVDYPDYIERMLASPEGNIKIVHVHGSYRFYDCKNLQNEITPAAATDILKGSAPKPYYKSIYGYLLAVLAKSVPIIIGYSGWNDVITAAIKHRLSAMMGYHIYWFCYNEKDYWALPPEIKNSDDVFIVVNFNFSDIKSSSKTSGDTSGENKEVRKKFEINEFDNHLGNQRFELTADDVLKELMNKLSVEDIGLLTNPFEHYKNILKSLLPNVSTQTLYNFDSIFGMLDKASDRLNSGTLYEDEQVINPEETVTAGESVDTSRDRAADTTSILTSSDDLQDITKSKKVPEVTNAEQYKPRQIDILINDIYALGRTGKQLAAIKIIYDIINKNNFPGLTDKQKNALTGSVHLLCVNMPESDKISALSVLSQIIGSKHPTDEDFLSTTMNENAVMLYDVVGHGDALRAHEELIKKFKELNNPKTIENVLRSYYGIGWIYDSLGQMANNKEEFKKANEKYIEAIDKYKPIFRDLTKSAKVTLSSLYIGLLRNYYQTQRLNNPAKVEEYKDEALKLYENETEFDIVRNIDKIRNDRFN